MIEPETISIRSMTTTVGRFAPRRVAEQGRALQAPVLRCLRLVIGSRIRTKRPKKNITPRLAAACLLACATTSAHAQTIADPSQWRTFGGNASRAAVTALDPVSIASPSWTFNKDFQNRTITFVGQSGPVIWRDFVYALGFVTLAGNQRQFSLFAIDRRAGSIVWSSVVTSPATDSWSSPVIDDRNAVVITATGKTLAAFDLRTGAPRWTTAMDRAVVNASPLITDDLGVANRLFITQFDGFGDSGLLTCVNIDPPLGIANPFQPGQIVWTAPVGASSGNTPAYSSGVVYSAAVGEYEVFGSVVAFDARDASSSPTPIWQTIVPDVNFFGGVSVRAADDGLWLYAATYAFEGELDAASLFKFDALTGSPVWSIPCNRTASTPIALDDGRIVLAAGLNGFGSLPSVEIFQDTGPGVWRAWHSVFDTWIDADGDDAIDLGEFLLLGGWSHLPVIAGATNAASPGVMFVGSMPTGSNFYAPCTHLRSLDLSMLPPLGSPTDPADRSFITGEFAGAGSTPAIADRNLYTIGAGGLHAFGPPPVQPDVNADGLVDIDDLYWWEQSRGRLDVNLDGSVNASDRDALLAAVRRDETLGTGGDR